MDTKIKAKWVRALRSGRYRQAQSELKSGDGAYCCLGVLCTIMGAEWRPDRRWGSVVARINGKTVNLVGDDTLKPSFLKRVGLTKDEERHLIRLNDGYDGDTTVIKRRRFKGIASYIEAKL